MSNSPSPRSDRNDVAIVSMEVAAVLGEKLHATLCFGVTQADVDLFFGRDGDPPPGSLTQEQNNYFQNFKIWSEQLFPTNGEENGKTLAENPTNRPVVGDRSEEAEKGC